jgi:hypothetical protein
MDPQYVLLLLFSGKHKIANDSLTTMAAEKNANRFGILRIKNKLLCDNQILIIKLATDL